MEGPISIDRFGDKHDTLSMETQPDDTSPLHVVGPKDRFPVVTVMEPTNSVYLLLALEIAHRPPVGFIF